MPRHIGRHLFYILYENALYIGTCFRFYTQMQVEKTNKAFAYRVPIGDYNYLQCAVKNSSNENAYHTL